MELSVLMSVYKNDAPSFLKEALESVFNQTVKPNELVLVKDGPINKELEDILNLYLSQYPDQIKLVKLEENMGLGFALQTGLLHCSSPLIARMDSDDICKPNRFEVQLKAFDSDPDLTIVGSAIDEFIEKPGDIAQSRMLPHTHQEIIKFSKHRNPFNHPTVMFKKDAVLKVGSYECVYLFEDYYLWLKLIQSGYKTGNVEKALLYFRIGNKMIKRRHGIKYAYKEIAFFWKAYRKKFISIIDFMSSVMLRAPLRLLPLKLLSYIYKNKLRK